MNARDNDRKFLLDLENSHLGDTYLDCGPLLLLDKSHNRMIKIG